MPVNNLKEYDSELRNKYPCICGIDEVGRGSLAGPIAAAAVVFSPTVDIHGINDSKQLSAVKRNFLSQQIQSSALAWSVEFISPEEIDKKGIQWANKTVMVRAAKNVKDQLELQGINIDLYIVDQSSAGFSPQPYRMFPKADGISLSVAAASILAKTTRDAFMESLSAKYPNYHLHDNSGYANPEHIKAVKEHGYVKGLHRFSFKIKSLIKKITIEELL